MAASSSAEEGADTVRQDHQLHSTDCVSTTTPESAAGAVVIRLISGHTAIRKAVTRERNLALFDDGVEDQTLASGRVISYPPVYTELSGSLRHLLSISSSGYE